jgi:predicted dehydrogenase
MARADVTRIAVVGYGYWGSKHVRVMSAIPGVVVTVVESNQLRRDEALNHFSNVRGADRLEHVLDDVDAVVVATPPASHFPVALEAVLAGKHVLVEKPLTTTVADAETLVQTADNNRVQLMVGHTFEYNAAVHKLKQIIDSGELGRVRYIDTARLSLGLYQRDVNVIWDLAPHDLSIVSYLLDELPSAVSVWGQHHVGHHHVDVAHVRLEFPDADTHAVIHTSWLDPCKVRRVTVAGERKMVVYNDMSDTERIRVYDVGVDELEMEDPGSHERPVSYRTGDIVSPYVQFREPLGVQDNHFVDCVRRNVTPNTPGQRGADIVKVLAATDQSLALGDGVRVPLHHEDRLVQSHRSNGTAA